MTNITLARFARADSIFTQLAIILATFLQFLNLAQIPQLQRITLRLWTGSTVEV